MKIVVIGAVAAGTSAAAKARRNDESAEIVIYEKDSHISYSGCGMPYYIGGVVENAGSLEPRDPAFFKSKYDVDVLTSHEVLSIDPDEKSVKVKKLDSGEVFTDHFDKLVIATGARASVPPIQGADGRHVFKLRNINDMNRIKSYIDTVHPRSAVIIGSGFIGLEMAENLKRLNMEVTLLELLPQVTPGMDPDMAVYVEDHLRENGITVVTSATTTEITERSVVLSDGQEFPADLVLVSTGVRPNSELAGAAGIELGTAGAIRVNPKMQTNIPYIYACGDCAEQFHVVTGQPVYRPLGSTANKMGRICGDSMTGGSLEYRGTLGTGIFQMFEMAVGQTGLTEREARELGYDVVVNHNTKPNRAEYMGARDMVIKGVADKNSGRMLGVQIVGFEGVDKRLDVFVTAITFGARAEDLFHLDLAYAPPFSTTKDPVMYTGMILENAINRGRELVTADGLDNIIHSGEKFTLIDARTGKSYEENHIKYAESIPHADLRRTLDRLDKDTTVITYCNRGTTGNAAQNILIGHGFKKVYNLSGGHRHYRKTHKK